MGDVFVLVKKCEYQPYYRVWDVSRPEAASQNDSIADVSLFRPFMDSKTVSAELLSDPVTGTAPVNEHSI